MTRHKEIFPPGFDSLSTSAGVASHYSFKSGQLYYSFLERCDPTTLVESIIVKSVWYGKRTQSTAGHEFLLVQVKDTANEGHINHIILDRNIGDVTPSSSTPIPSSRSYPTADIADDQFRIAYDGDAGKLLQECSFSSYQMLEKLQFPAEQPFYFYELVTLASVVSELYPSYNAADSNCYLYAGLIWECMLRAHPTALHRNDMGENRGKIGWIRYSPTNEAKENVYATLQKRMVNVRKRIKKNQRPVKLREAMTRIESDSED